MSVGLEKGCAEPYALFPIAHADGNTLSRMTIADSQTSGNTEVPIVGHRVQTIAKLEGS
jgi:hypothetical protein